MLIKAKKQHPIIRRMLINSNWNMLTQYMIIEFILDVQLRRGESNPILHFVQFPTHVQE